MGQKFPQVRNRLILSLVLNGLVPALLFGVLRNLGVPDIAALTIVLAIPLSRTLTLWIIRRHLDWIGLLSTLSLVCAMGVVVFSNGNALPLELHGSVLYGVIGLIFVISVLVRKPMLPLLVRLLMRNSPNRLNLPTSVQSADGSQRRLTVITFVLGIALLVKAIVDVLLAIILPIATFLTVSRIINWLILGSALAYLWLTRQGDRTQTNHIQR